MDSHNNNSDNNFGSHAMNYNAPLQQESATVDPMSTALDHATLAVLGGSVNNRETSNGSFPSSSSPSFLDFLPENLQQSQDFLDAFPLPQRKDAMDGNSSQYSVPSVVSYGTVTAANAGSRKRLQNQQLQQYRSLDVEETRKRKHRDGEIISEDESEQKRRRQDRNWREQQRSQKLSQQIVYLKDILQDANIEVKADKYSTLVSIEEYIKTLQARTNALEQENKNLLKTVKDSSEVVAQQYSKPFKAEDSSSSPSSSEALQHIHNVDYKIVFKSSPYPLAIASVDGRFMDCNTEFEMLTGYKRDELLPLEVAVQQNVGLPFCTNQQQQPPPRNNLSLFNVLQKDSMQTVFGAMSSMLRQSEGADSWNHLIELCRNPSSQVTLIVTLVRTPGGQPRFFNCAFVPLN